MVGGILFEMMFIDEGFGMFDFELFEVVVECLLEI